MRLRSAIILLLLLAAAGTAQAALLPADHDTWVRQQDTGYNGGGDASLRVREGSNAFRSFVQFDLTQVAPSGDGTLILRGVQGSGPVSVYLFGRQIDEGSETWATIGDEDPGQLLGDTGECSGAGDCTLSIELQHLGGDYIALALRAAGGALAVGSEENGSAGLRPELDVPEGGGGGCAGPEDCGLCQTCDNGTCVNQAEGEDLLEECPPSECMTGSCNGAGACGTEDAGTACGDPGSGSCDAPDSCDGAGICETNHADPGTSCDNGDYCDGADTCGNDGTCQSSGSPCEPSATCDEPADQCLCTGDGDCAVGETCVDGVCAGSGGDGLPTGVLTITGDAGPGGSLGNGNCSNDAAHCYSFEVSGCGIATLGGSIEIKEPAGAVEGNVLMHKGGGGTSYLRIQDNDGNNIDDDVVAEGYRAILIRWDSDWQESLDGLMASACRPSTVFKEFVDHVDGAHNKAAYSGAQCIIGISGGVGATSYAMAHYGLDDQFDHLSLLSGPPFTRLDYGCYPETIPAAELETDLCSAGVDAKYQLQPPRLDPWVQPCSCSQSNPTTQDLECLENISIESANADWNWGAWADMYFCSQGSINATSGMGDRLFDNLTGDKAWWCYSDTCNGEKVYHDARTDLLRNLNDRCGTP
ncbi:hypothetical protein ABI59_10270 [Acidobacteria bacterium Mor1]|nr:hypothetical protein ABI59_10270 [Acidobacteria bacterium Mor1]